MPRSVSPGTGSDRCAMILAGGNGMRLRSLTRRITGDERPKQFCPVIGDRTLLEQTWRRTGQVVPPERTLLVFTRRHERFYQPLISELKAHHVVAQPEKPRHGGRDSGTRCSDSLRARAATRGLGRGVSLGPSLLRRGAPGRSRGHRVRLGRDVSGAGATSASCPTHTRRKTAGSSGANASPDPAGRPCIRSPAFGRSRILHSPACSETAAATGTASSWWRGCQPCRR